MSILKENPHPNSMRAYLERQSTEDLESMLRYCLDRREYYYAVKDILKVLKERDKLEATELSPRIMSVWEKYLKQIDLDTHTVLQFEEED